MKIRPEDIEVKIEFVQKEKMLARATLILGQFEIRGYKILRSEKTLLVVYPPAVINSSKHYTDIVRITEKDDWHELQDYILKKYDEAVEKTKYENINEQTRAGPD